MAETMTLEPTAAEAAELQAQISHYLAEMKRLNEQMARDQERIDTLKSESRVITAETRVLMDGLQSALSEMSAA
jgi:prefoldin subunit 5